MQLTQLLWQSVPNYDGIREEQVPIDLCPCILDKGQVCGENGQNLTGLYFSPLFRVLYIRTIPFKKDKKLFILKKMSLVTIATTCDSAGRTTKQVLGFPLLNDA